MPFLENVTRGRNVPRERLLGGRPPLRAVRRRQPDQRAEPRADRRARGRAATRTASTCRSTSATATGIRSSPTRCAQMRDDGVERALAVFTSAFSSYSGCRQYREDLFNAQQAVGADAPEVPRDADVLQPPRLRSRRTSIACATRCRELPARRRARRVHGALDPRGDGAQLCRTKPSCESRRGSSRRPSASTTGRSSTRAAAGRRRCRGSSPDISDHLEDVAARGVRSVVVSPIGFVSDHLEVLFDLDIEARETAERARAARSPAPGRPGRIPRSSPGSAS